MRDDRCECPIDWRSANPDDGRGPDDPLIAGRQDESERLLLDTPTSRPRRCTLGRWNFLELTDARHGGGLREGDGNVDSTGAPKIPFGRERVLAD